MCKFWYYLKIVFLLMNVNFVVNDDVLVDGIVVGLVAPPGDLLAGLLHHVRPRGGALCRNLGIRENVKSLFHFYPKN